MPETDVAFSVLRISVSMSSMVCKRKGSWSDRRKKGHLCFI